MSRLALPSVTLCAVTSVNVRATIAALQESIRKADFAECLLFTDAADLSSMPRIRVVPIRRLNSSADYSEFLLRGLAGHVQTEHCLVVQWDGFVLDPSRWDPGFLDYDYIGAGWPQFADGYDVGNGGFSLRSRKLLQACLDPRFDGSHPEDMAICRTNRRLLEDAYGLQFADRATADRFSFERSVPQVPTFGFHGIFNMIGAIGVERFWKVYRTLDDRSTAFVDFSAILKQLGSGPRSIPRRIALTRDRLDHSLKRRCKS